MSSGELISELGSTRRFLYVRVSWCGLPKADLRQVFKDKSFIWKVIQGNTSRGGMAVRKHMTLVGKWSLVLLGTRGDSVEHAPELF